MSDVGSLQSNGTPRNSLTTGRVAQVCGVAPGTVAKWCERGLLQSYRIPGGRDRRVYPEDLEAFCLSNGMARVVTALRGVRGVYVLSVGVGADAAAALGECLPDGWQMRTVETVWQTATAFHQVRPVGVILDASIGRCNVREIAEAMLSARPRPRVVVVVPADCEPGAYLPGVGVVEVSADLAPAEVSRRLTGGE